MCYKLWKMHFNSIIREAPYLLRAFVLFLYKIVGVAWLLAARVLKCLVKSYNERNPYLRKHNKNCIALRNCSKALRERRGLLQIRMTLISRARSVLQKKGQYEAKM